MTADTDVWPSYTKSRFDVTFMVDGSVYHSDKYNGTDTNLAAKRMFDAAGVKYTQYKETGRNISISL